MCGTWGGNLSASLQESCREIRVENTYRSLLGALSCETSKEEEFAGGSRSRSQRMIIEEMVTATVRTYGEHVQTMCRQAAALGWM
jgi:hypothetical protein